MNIFVLDLDPAVAARHHCDKHVVKMPTETAQILCTALRLSGYRGQLRYKPTHHLHPCVRWAAESRSNFRWLAELGRHLVAEHGRRYANTRAGQRGHAAGPVIAQALELADEIPDGELTAFAQAMPLELRGDDPVAAYRRYYVKDKVSIATWRLPSVRPSWMREG